MSSKIEKLEKLYSLMKEDTVTPAQLKAFLEMVLSTIKNSKSGLESLTKEHVELIKSSVAFIEENKKSFSKEIKDIVSSETQSTKKDFSQSLKEAKSFLAEVKKIKEHKANDGHTPEKGVDYFTDEEISEIKKEVTESIKLPEVKEQTGEDIVSKINDLPLDDDKKIDAKHIKNLPKPNNNGGGSTARSFYQLHDTPDNYSGAGGYKVKVKADESGLEFVEDTGGSGGSSVSVNGVEVPNPNFVNSPEILINEALGDISFEIESDSIQKTKLENAVKDSLDLADSAVQPGDLPDFTQYQLKAIVVSGNTTAVLDDYYDNVATATYTDPTPVEGKGFTVFVRNGTATVGGTAYATAGTVIKRVFHSGSWSNTVFVPQGNMSGDATQAITGAVTIANDAVTYAKMQNVSATARVLGRVTAGAGDVEEIVIDNDLSSVSASDDTVASAKAIKTYVDTKSFSTVFMNNLVNLGLGAGLTRYISLTSPSSYQVTFPVLSQAYAPIAGSFSKMTIYISTAQPASGSFVCTAQKNGTNQALKVVIAAGSAAGFYSDTTNSFSVAAGDYVTVECVNNATAASGSLRGISCVFTA